jgi:hypothetical protein
MNIEPKKTLSLSVRTGKTVYKPAPSSAGAGSYRMDEWAGDNQRMSNEAADRPRYDRPRGDRPRNDRPRNDRPRNDRPRSDIPKPAYPKADHFRGDSARDERGNRYGGQHQQDDASPNKIRRGPGRRLAKEKRIRSMDPALMQKYATLPPALQEKVNATIEIYYQQQMAKAYKGQLEAAEPEAEDDDFIEEDVVIDTEEPLGS